MPVPPELLGPDEEVLVDVRPHWVFLAAPVALTVVAVAAAGVIAGQLHHPPAAVPAVLTLMVVVPGAWFAARWVRWLGISLVLTDRRLLLRHGWFGREQLDVDLGRVVGVRCAQSLVERLVGSGTLLVELAGSPEVVTVDDVRRPRALQRVVAARLEHGPPPETDPVPAPRGRPAALLAPGDPTPPRGVPVAASAVRAGGPALDDSSWASLTDRLVQLDELRRRGILTQSEFDAKKADLLGRL
ncbi:MAG TPA: PH domain-containing protein [Acidimicrobiales bacterium]|nr:PH domain-containing protein [Acidimicrobiales bacterium]